MTDAETIVARARGWLGTPYHHQVSVKHVGCDCLGLIRGLWRGKGWQGHVTFFDREVNGRLVCLGGNQSDKVCFAIYRKSLVLGYRGKS